MTGTPEVIRVLLAVPVPPPYSGPEINGAMLLRHGLGDGFRTTHLDPGVRTGNEGKGRVTAGALVALARLWGKAVAASVRTRPHVAYLYLAQNRTGFVRDAVIILTAWAFGAKVVAHIRGGNFENFHRHASAPERWFIRIVMRRLTRVVLVADRFRGQFATLVAAGRLRVLYNGVDEAVLGALAPAAHENASVTLLFVGHLSVAKGFADLLRALPELLDAHPSLRLVAAGEWLEKERNILFDEEGRPVPAAPGLKAEWQVLHARYGGRVTHAGVLAEADKARALRSADILVLPSYSEGFPMAVLEGMTAGLPLVVTRAGALAEILEEGTNALFVPAGDPAALAQRIGELAGDADRRRAMGARNRRLVEERFTFEAVQRGLATILREAAAAP